MTDTDNIPKGGRGNGGETGLGIVTKKKGGKTFTGSGMGGGTNFVNFTEKLNVPERSREPGQPCAYVTGITKKYLIILRIGEECTLTTKKRTMKTQLGKITLVQTQEGGERIRSKSLRGGKGANHSILPFDGKGTFSFGFRSKGGEEELEQIDGK